MRDNLDGVSVFVTVVEEGGFSRAADRLGLTRSAVGKAIARLETRLRVRLFNRTTRSQSLTEEGQIYHERCIRAITELRAGEQMIESGRQDVFGKVRLSAPLLFGRYCVQPILLDLAAQHPGLELDLNLSDNVVDIIGEGFDLAIRIGQLSGASVLKARKIASQQKILCAAPSYIEKHGRPINIDDLSKHEALIYIRNGNHFPWHLKDMDGSIVEARVSGRFTFNSQEAIADAAAHGRGIAWVPSWLVRQQLEAGQLVRILEAFPTTALETYAVWPATNHLPKRLRVVIDTLAVGLKNQRDNFSGDSVNNEVDRDD